VHAYCWDEHVLQAHRPPFEIGGVSLDGQFEVRESETESPVSEAQESQEQGSEEKISEEESTEEQTTPLLG
jgi:hypothetical protein